jgi:hypothetical protein
MEHIMFGFINGQCQSRPINVDCLSDDDKRALAKHPATHADVAVYANLTLEAERYRLAGNVALALRLEKHADFTYQSLIPKHLRW